jgi:hypothetical protein
MRRRTMKTLTVIVISVLLIALGGCKGDEGAVGPPGPGGSGLKGNIFGSVTLYTEDGIKESSFAGVSVYIEGRSDTVLSDSLGRWKLANVPAGIHTIALAKAGYGFTKMPQVQFVGGGDLYLFPTFLSEPPSYTVNTVQVTIDLQGIIVHGTLSTSLPEMRSHLLLFGKVDPMRTDPYSWLQSDGPVTYASESTFATPPRDSSFFTEYGFHSGDTIHVAVYPSSEYNNGYFDFVSGRGVMSTGFGPAVRTTFVLP